jgi:tetratricopeptide (TPR) repeat protein
MASIPELLHAAETWHRSGQLGPAEQAYRQILERDPGHAEALGQLGLLAYQDGRPGQAAEYLRRATAAEPADSDRHNNLGAALFDLGRAAEAEAAYREALRLEPAFAEAHHNLGDALRAQGRPLEAEAAYRQALQLQPGLAEAPNGLGEALREQGRLTEAEAAYRQSLRLRPDYPEAINNLGNALHARSRWAEAEAVYREALRLRPGYPEALNNLGGALRDQGRPAEAEAACREALRRRSDYPEAHANLGNALGDQGRPAEAEAEYREALRLRPDFVEAHSNLSMLLLSLGRFAEGWAEYEWRLRVPGLAPRAFGRPAWEGPPFGGRTLLLWAEQGLGDTLQFVRYAAVVKERTGAVVLECPPALVPLLSRCPGVDRVVGRGSPLPAFDAHAPLLSLPHLLGTTLESVPAAVPYLSADPSLVRQWWEQLRPLTGFRIGIAWQGSKYSDEQRRSLPLRSLAPLAAVPGVRLVSLQKGAGVEQLAAAADLGVAELGEGVDQAGAFVDTAAVMQNLDLVVTADTAIAHLAGGLGVPTWLALSTVPNWRWLHDRADSPWYPTLRLFRQTQRGDWGDVFGRMAGALRERLG